MKTEREKQQLLRQKQEKKVQSARKPKQLLAIYENSDFENVHVEIIIRLERMMKYGEPKALEAMRTLAAQAPRLGDRCETAFRLPDRTEACQAMDQAMRAGLASGELEKLAGYAANYHPTSWFDLIRDDGALMSLLYDQGGSHIRSRVLNCATDKDLLRRILLESDKLSAGDALDIAGKLQLTQNDWEEIITKARSQSIVSYAIRQLDLKNRTLLEKLADDGSIDARHRLLELSPDYTSRFVDSLSSEQLERALNRHRLSQEALEKLCLEYRPSRNRTGTWYGSRMMEALSQLTDPDRLEHVLKTQQTQVKTYITDRGYETWLEALVSRFASSQDLLASFLISSSNRAVYYSAEKHALELLTDPDLLVKVAAVRCYMSKEAAKKLPAEKLQTLVEGSKDQDVRQYAAEQVHLARTSTTKDEQELLDTLSWAVKETRDKELGLQVAKKLRSQKAMLKALSICGDESREGPAREAREALLPRIKDGEGLMKFILEEPDRVHYDTPRRLHEIIGGTPLEQEFIDRNIDSYREAGMRGRQLWILSKFLGCFETEIAWKYYGEAYIRKLIADLENAKEHDSAAIAANNLKTWYRTMPVVRPLIDPYKGKRYTKHADFDATCASESRHENTTFIFDIK
ncbi:MAG: hypothetical protein J5589_03300 [Firmicutes bacterium]|nr:hypothetical protein [Bacillota bacterium]